MNDATAVTAVTVSDDLRAARESVEIERAREELRQIRLREKLDHHYRAQIRESVYCGYSGNGFGDFVDPLDAFRDSDLRVTPLGTASRHDRQDGYNRPFVWHEIDLDLMRAQSRWIATKNLLGVGAVECLADYTVRTGFEYQARPRQGLHKDGAARALAAQVQSVVDEHCSFNLIERQGEQYTWADREWECVSQSVIDGECILRVFDQNDGGLCLVRPVQPELIRQAPGTSPLYSFGILNRPGDVESIDEYAVWYDSTEPEFVPACDVAFLKLNSPSNVKRGLSDFYAGAELFDDTRKMLRNMVVTGGVQAAIAWIEQFDEATAAALQAHIEAVRDQNRPQYPRPFTGKDVSYQKIEPGSIPKVGGGRTYVPQPAAVNASSHYTTIQAGLRALATRWKMPEHTFSGDASNSNYASILAAGAPFVVRTECRQAVYGRFFVLVLWKGPIACAARAGRFRVGGHRYTYEEVSRLVDVIATPPQVAISDPQKESEIDHKDLTAGVMSIQTRRARRGLDDETEDKNLKEHPLTRVEGRATDLDSQGNPLAPHGQGQQPAEGESQSSQAALRATVGGLQALQSLQTAVYGGQVSRGAAIANVMLMFGFDQREAEQLFPEDAPQKTADEGGQGGGGAVYDSIGRRIHRESFAPDAFDARALRESFTGRKTDSLGRVRCYSDGKPVPCHAAEHSGGQSDRAHSVATERLRKLMDSPQTATPADVQKTTKALMRLTQAEAKQLQAKYGLKARGNKRQQAEAIAAEASRVVGEREQYARKALAAGVDAEQFFATADEVYAHATDYREQIRAMLADARDAYKAESGKTLNNLHRAFRGGDYTDIPGFERIARSMADRYPEILGAHGYETGDNDSTAAAEKLYELMYNGVPQYRRADAYDEALSLASGRAAAPSFTPSDGEVPF